MHVRTHCINFAAMEQEGEVVPVPVDDELMGKCICYINVMYLFMCVSIFSNHVIYLSAVQFEQPQICAFENMRLI
jgi:hypothetical protein